jgi:hypothetical protein
MMSYTTIDYPSKKAIKKALAEGRTVTCFNPGLGPDLSRYTGTVYLEGPHYPKPHRWYAVGKLKEGRLISIK